jgi:NitT/TauT family transport system substrate-binding protein
MKRRWTLWIAMLLIAMMLFSACGGAEEAGETPAPTEESGEEEVADTPEPAEDEGETEGEEGEASGELTPVRLQLQWVAQSQFAGYYAAAGEGFYEEEGIDIQILEGAPDIVPQQVCVNGGAEFCIAWVPKALASREEGADLVNIAQIFQRSGTLEVAFVESGIQTVADLRGKRVGVWDFGNEHEVFAALRQEGIDPENPDDVTIRIQPFDMTLLLQGEIDAAEAMTYNEYAQVLEQTNPATGELYQPEDLVVIDFNEVGTAMLQDAIWTTASWLAQEGNEDLAVRFLRASFRGWIFCRDNFDACVGHVLDAGPTLGEGHMRWQLNEVNALIWPSPGGIGIMDQSLWEQTVRIALEGQVFANEPDAEAFRADLAEQAEGAVESEGLDTVGADFQKIEVEVTPGGE